MSNKDPHFNNVTEQEFGRVLTNPTNVIMSEELADLLPSHETEDTISLGAITIENADEDEIIEIPCLFRSMSAAGKTYRLELELSDPMFFMNTITTVKKGFSLSIKDKLQFEIINSQLESWDVFKDVDSFIVGLGVKGEVQF